MVILEWRGSMAESWGWCWWVLGLGLGMGV